MALGQHVTKLSVTVGAAEGGSLLNAFDNALLVAGIGNVNLVKVSSIVPPGVEIEPIPAGATLAGLLAAGQIDAL